jgi:hypothetical protein
MMGESEGMKTAREIASLYGFAGMENDLAPAIAKAIDEAVAAERERCANIADEVYIEVPLTAGAADGASIAARQIAAAIRRAPSLTKQGEE